jgi:hypothetical protein
MRDTSPEPGSIASATREEISFSREMGIGHAEFLRTLPRAVAGLPYTVEDDTVILDDGGRRLRISLSPRGERVVGSVRLPTSVVSFKFSGYTRGEVERFMNRFDLYFHRGGG